MLNYNHLHYFHVVASEGTIAAAAAKLGVGTPTVSEQIRALERALRVSLFQRTASGLKLTEAGRFAHEHTAVMFRAGERLVEALSAKPSDVPRTLRVGLSAGVGRSITTDFLMPLLALDDCVPTIITGNAVDLVRDLRAHELDLVLCESEPVAAAREGLQMAEIAKTTLVAVAPPSVSPNTDWTNVGLVHHRPSAFYHAEVDDYLRAQNLRPRVVAEADDLWFQLEAAARGGFVAFVPQSLVRDAVGAKRVRVIAKLDAPHAAVHALYPDGQTFELARKAVDVLVAYARANPLE